MNSNTEGGGCGKRAFPTLADAEQALLDARIAQALRPSRTRRHEKRAYVCRTCGAWHVTKQDRKDTAA